MRERKKLKKIERKIFVFVLGKKLRLGEIDKKVTLAKVRKALKLRLLLLLLLRFPLPPPPLLQTIFKQIYTEVHLLSHWGKKKKTTKKFARKKSGERKRKQN